MTNISNIRDELVTLIDEVEQASAMRTGAVFAFIPSFITSARAGVERIDEGLANISLEDGEADDFDRREATNQINEFVESFRSIYCGSLSGDDPEWTRWNHEGKLADFYANFFAQIDALPTETKEPILALVNTPMEEARQTFETWRTQDSSEANAQLTYCRSLAYTLRDLCIETLDLLGYTGKEILQTRLKATDAEPAAAATS